MDLCYAVPEYETNVRRPQGGMLRRSITGACTRRAAAAVRPLILFQILMKTDTPARLGYDVLTLRWTSPTAQKPTKGLYQKAGGAPSQYDSGRVQDVWLSSSCAAFGLSCPVTAVSSQR